MAFGLEIGESCEADADSLLILQLFMSDGNFAPYQQVSSWKLPTLANPGCRNLLVDHSV